MTKSIYQWILQDHQEMHFNRFEITESYFATKEELEAYYPNLYPYRGVVGKYKPSKISDEHVISILRKHQAEEKLKRDREQKKYG